MQSCLNSIPQPTSSWRAATDNVAGEVTKQSDGRGTGLENPPHVGGCFKVNLGARPVSSKATTDKPAWFCVRTHPKHEHIAAAQLRREPDVEVFLPRIRYRRPTRCGPAWVTEALFRDYLFARFEPAAALRRVHHARAVSGVVRFGDHCPSIPDSIITDLQE